MQQLASTLVHPHCPVDTKCDLLHLPRRVAQPVVHQNETKPTKPPSLNLVSERQGPVDLQLTPSLSPLGSEALVSGKYA